MKYHIVSEHVLSSDFLPKNAFKKTYSSLSSAIAIAIEGVDDPAEQQVLVLDEKDVVVWDSFKEKFE